MIIVEEVKAEADRCLAMVEEDKSDENSQNTKYKITEAGIGVITGTYNLVGDDEYRIVYENDEGVQMYYSKEHDYWNICRDGIDYYYFAGNVNGETDPTKIIWEIDQEGMAPIPTIVKINS